LIAEDFMSKVKLFDKRVAKIFLEIASGALAAISAVLLFVDIPAQRKLLTGVALLLVLAGLYLVVWIWSNRLNQINLSVEGSSVNIRVGDIFKQAGFKVIAFNEYFDTVVDDRIISAASLNGIFLQKHLDISIAELDRHIDEYPFEIEDRASQNLNRAVGKKSRYEIGAVCVYKDFLLASFSRFDENNKANLTMPEYLGFLIKFWDRVNTVYAQRNVSTTIFGSGITRIKGHKTISDEDLLKIMLWTFRISEMRFKYPAKLSIIIHPDKIDQINLLDVYSAQ